jgi:hypothetical protein
MISHSKSVRSKRAIDSLPSLKTESQLSSKGNPVYGYVT